MSSREITQNSREIFKFSQHCMFNSDCFGSEQNWQCKVDVGTVCTISKHLYLHTFVKSGRVHGIYAFQIDQTRYQTENTVQVCNCQSGCALKNQLAIFKRKSNFILKVHTNTVLVHSNSTIGQALSV